MLAHLDDWTPSAQNDKHLELLSAEVEQEISALLLAKGPELSAANSFRIAASLLDSAAATIVTLQTRVASLETEREKLGSQELAWEAPLTKWKDMANGLKAQIRDLEGKLAQANQRAIRAEVRAQNLEEDIANSQRGSFDLCDKVIATFGNEDSLILRLENIAGEVAGSC